MPPKSLLQARDATCGAAVRGVWPDCAGRDARVQSVRIRQYATFTLFSGSMTAGEITARLMVEPDKIRTRGSRQAAPPVPAHHAWKIVCDHRSLTVEGQVGQVIDRLRPHQDAIAELVREPAADCTAQLNLVRYFGDDDGEEEERSSPDSRLQKIPGQHQLLGWHLDRGTIAFLAAVHAEIDVDEYG